MEPSAFSQRTAQASPSLIDFFKAFPTTLATSSSPFDATASQECPGELDLPRGIGTDAMFSNNYNILQCTYGSKMIKDTCGLSNQ